MTDSTEMIQQQGASTMAHSAVQQVQFSPEQAELIKNQILKGGSDDELKVFLYQCSRTGLDPFTRQIFGIKRWDDEAKKETLGVMVSIDGLRLIAERTGKYRGQTPVQWCGEDGVWKDVWLASEPPAAARVGVLKAGFSEPLYRVARFSSYAGKKKDGGLTRMWRTMGDVMIAKCAEALALRTAFPHELSGLYSEDEMGQAETNDNDTDQKPKPERTSSRKKETLPKPPAPPPPAHDEQDAPTKAEEEVFLRLAKAASPYLRDDQKAQLNREWKAGHTGTGIRLAIDHLKAIMKEVEAGTRKPVGQAA